MNNNHKAAFHAHLNAAVPELPHADFEEVWSVLKPIQRRKHQYLIQEGDSARYEYWVVSGCLKAYYLDKQGKEHIVQFATEGWWISDYGAYFNRQPASLFIDCIEDCQLLALTLDQREQLCRALPLMERFWRLKVQSGYVALQQRILALLHLSAEARYRQLLERYPDLPQRVPKKMLAAYLGVSRETLSRLSV